MHDPAVFISRGRCMIQLNSFQGVEEAGNDVEQYCMQDEGAAWFGNTWGMENMCQGLVGRSVGWLVGWLATPGLTTPGGWNIGVREVFSRWPRGA